MPLLVASVVVHHPALQRRSREAMEHAARLSAHLVEDISGVDTIKAFGLERPRAQEGESRLVRIVQSVFSLQKLALSMGSAGMLVTAVAGVVILWYGGHRVIQGALSVGQLLFFYTLLGYLLGPLERLASVNLQIQDALVAIHRLYEIMDLDGEPLGDRRKVQFDRLRQMLALEDVSFQYGCRENVLEKITLRIPAGSTAAIVGESGSGKSTLLKLLLRFYEPSEGRILIDGHDARDYELRSLRSKIGLVAQDPFVFSGTIRENIALGRPDTTMGQIVEAARTAGLDSFIASLPDRYETIVGERGANLSGGQRQRLAIARALVREPEILVFDEATSHLDTATEQAIQRSLRAELAGKTVVLVAHRLSTVKDADVIYVLHQGRIVEQGSHRELIAREGRYASLWRAQTGDLPALTPPRPALAAGTHGITKANGNGRCTACAAI